MSTAPSYSDCGREFNKCVMNVSSSILCPVFISSVHFFSMKASQSIGFCLVCSNLLLRNFVYTSTLSSLVFGFHLFPRLFLSLFLSIYWMWHFPQCSMIFHQLTSQGPCSLSYWLLLLLIYLSWSSVHLLCLLQVSQSFLFVRWSYSPINNTITAPAVSYDYEFQGKFMPILLCVIEFVDLDAP